jgi:single-stranded DNA-binding protein
METEKKKNEEIILKGKVKSGYADLPDVVITKAGDKPIAKFNIVTKNGQDISYTNCVAWDSNIPKVEKLIKDDLVELKGYFGNEYTTKKGETKRDFVIKECTKLNTTIKGNIGQGYGDNPEIVIKEVSGKQVANFSVAINDANEKGDKLDPKWYNCQAWGENIKLVENLKKGDFVELKGVFGKEYKNSKGELKQDFIVNSSNLLMSAAERIEKQKELEKLNDQDKALVNAVKKGDYKQVELALKNGGNPDSISKDHYSKLSDQAKKAIENAIDKHNLGTTINEEKKNNKISM